MNRGQGDLCQVPDRGREREQADECSRVSFNSRMMSSVFPLGP